MKICGYKVSVPQNEEFPYIVGGISGLLSMIAGAYVGAVKPGLCLGINTEYDSVKEEEVCDIRNIKCMGPLIGCSLSIVALSAILSYGAFRVAKSLQGRVYSSL
jgi:hypothetical protein